MPTLEKRDNPRPHEYPICKKYIKAFQQSFWTVDIVPFGSDRHDYENTLSDKEKSLVYRCSLAISTIEVKVKNFWAKAGIFIDVPEIGSTCFTFANSEVIHEEAYSKIFEELGIDIIQSEIEKIPEIASRIRYLKKHLGLPYEDKRKAFAYTLAIFAATIEGISLFSQFYIIKAIQKHRNSLQAFGTVTDYTANEEILHSNFGIWLFNTMVEEYPDIFDQEFINHVKKGVKACLKPELRIVDWIFEEGDLPYLKKEDVVSFVHERYNKVVESFNFEDIAIKNHKIDYDKTDWFYEQIGNKQGDFLNKRTSDYSALANPVKKEELF